MILCKAYITNYGYPFNYAILAIPYLFWPYRSCV
jgi:hypothetical protein